MLLFLSTLALAQTPDLDAAGSSPQRVAPLVVPPVQELIFDGTRVGAGLIGPDGKILLERKRAVFNPLVHLRTDFSDLIAQDAAQVR